MSGPEYYKLHKERLLRKSYQWKRNNPEKHRLHQSKAQIKHYWFKRFELMDLLGGTVCNKCGLTDLCVLQIDHIKGGGTKNSMSSIPNINYFLRRPNLAKQELQVLCANCNRRKVYENKETRNVRTITDLYLIRSLYNGKKKSRVV